jgi:hypothetical protein
VLDVKQLILSGVTFLVVFLPLLIFYGVNYLGLPEIVTDVICFNKFTAARTGEAFISFGNGFGATALSNLKSMLLAVSIGDDRHTLAHYYPGYATLFEFTFPITFIGFISALVTFFKGKRAKDADKVYLVGNGIFLFITLACAVLEIVILPDISRMVMLFIPVIYFFVKGAAAILQGGKAFFIAVAALLLVGGASFTKDYFTDFNQWSISIFMPGYGDAIKRAYEIAGDERQIYSTYEGLSSPFMLALYYNEYDPHKFYTTVEYKDPTAEFRIARSFGNFVFELPGDENEKVMAGDVFVVATSEENLFVETEGLNVEEYGGYAVVYR